MPNTTISTAEASGFIPEIWLATALGQLKAYLTLYRSVTLAVDLDGGSAFTQGQTLHLPKRGTLVANDKVEKQNYTIQAPQSSDVNLTLNYHKEVTFAVESRAIATSNQDVVGGYTADAVIVLAEAVDAAIASVWNDAAIPAANKIAIAGAALADADLLKARKLLVDARVPYAAPKVGLLSTTQANSLMSDGNSYRYDSTGVPENIVNATVGDGQRMMPGEFGQLRNFRLAESQLVPYVAGASKNLFYAKDAILFASRALENPEVNGAGGVKSTVMTDPDSGITMRLLHSYQHLAGGHLVTLDILFGRTLMRPEHIVVVSAAE